MYSYLTTTTHITVLKHLRILALQIMYMTSFSKT